MKLRSKVMVTGVTVMALTGATVGAVAASGSGSEDGSTLSAASVTEENAGPQWAFDGVRGGFDGGPGAFPLGEGPNGEGGEGRIPRDSGPIDVVMTLLGMKPEEFIERLRGGETPVQIAASAGVDEATVINTIVAEVTLHASERVTEWANNTHNPGERIARARGATTIAALFGISVEELRDLAQPGTTMAELAAGFGLTGDDVVAAIVAEADAHLQAKVDAGEMTADEKADKFAEITARETERVNTLVEERPEGGLPANADAADPTLAA
jgi:uncharacterized protein (DUF433 family)